MDNVGNFLVCFFPLGFCMFHIESYVIAMLLSRYFVKRGDFTSTKDICFCLWRYYIIGTVVYFLVYFLENNIFSLCVFLSDRLSIEGVENIEHPIWYVMKMAASDYVNNSSFCISGLFATLSFIPILYYVVLLKILLEDWMFELLVFTNLLILYFYKDLFGTISWIMVFLLIIHSMLYMYFKGEYGVIGGLYV